MRGEHHTARASLQPAFFWEFGDGYIHNYGRARADTMFPVKSLIAAGVPVAGSSDAPVTHYAPLFDIEQALTRTTMAGDPWSRRARGPAHRHPHAHHQRDLRID